jgi:hypothetical protein
MAAVFEEQRVVRTSGCWSEGFLSGLTAFASAVLLALFWVTSEWLRGR